MRRLLHFVKSAFIFARHQVWADAGLWQAIDAIALTAFFSTPTGARLRQFLAASIVRQQAHALTKTQPNDLVYEAGYCAGQRALAAAIEGLCDNTKFTEQGDTEADPATNHAAS